MRPRRSATGNSIRRLAKREQSSIAIHFFVKIG
jgi:hypothetical protein